MKTILAIDDQKDNLTTIKAVMKDYMPNCKVITALSGSEGIKIAREQQPDTILLDIIMPGMDGFEVCKEIKADNSTKPIPVIMLTAIKTDAESRVRGLNLGADAFLSKPIDPIELTAQVNVMLRIKAAEDKLRAEKENLEETVTKRTVDLLESEEKYKDFTNLLPQIVFETDLKGNLTFMNKLGMDVFGYEQKDIDKGINILQGITKKDRERVNNIIQNIPVQNISGDPEYLVVRKDGSTFPSLIYSRINYKNNIPAGMQGIIVDITDRKKKEETISESEEKLRLVIDNSPIGVTTTDLNGYFLDVNAAMSKISGYSREKMIGKHFNQFSYPDDVEKNNNLFEKLVKGEITYFDLEKRYIHKTGNIVHVLIKAQLIRDTEGKPLFQTAIIEDITQRKHDKDLLKEQEARIRSIFRSAPVGIGVVSNRIITQVNNRLCEMTGYTADELLNQNSILFYPTQQEHENVGLVKYDQIKKQGTGTVETLFKRKDGKIIDVLLSSTPINPDDLDAGVTFTALDITESKQAEQEIRESEQKFRFLADNTYDWEYWINPEGQYIYLSQSCERITGYSPEEFYKNPDFLFKLVRPEFVEMVQKHYRNEMHKQAPTSNFEFSLINRSGDLRWIDHNCTAIFDGQGNFLGRCGNNRDITERKKTEENIRKLSTAVEQSPSIIVITDITGIIEYANPKFTELTGYSNAELVGQNPRILKSGEQSDAFYKEFWETISAGNEWHGEFHNKKKNGDFFWESASISPIFDSHGKITNYIKVAEDITERKQTQEALQESRLQLKLIIDKVPGMLAFVDANKKYLYVNIAYADFYGIRRKNFIGKSIKEMLPTVSYKNAQKNSKLVLSGKETINENMIPGKDGSERFILTKNIPHFDENGKIIAFLVTIEDITERKLAEDLLRQSEEKFRKAFLTSPDAVNINRLNDGKYITINKGFTKIMGYSEENIIGKTSREIEIWENIEDREKLVAGLKANGFVENLEAKFRTKNGVSIDGLMSASLLMFDGVSHILSITRDITERIRAEQIQKVLYNISQAAFVCQSLEELISIIQEQLGKIIDTKNFYIAFYDKKTDTFTSPYVNYKKDKLTKWKGGKTYSAYVVKTGKSLLVTKANLKNLKAAGEIVNVGIPSEVWFGVPLITEDVVKGVFAVQSYTDENAYNSRDLEILEFVASQISTSLERKNAEKTLIESEERYKTLSTITFQGIVLHDNEIIVDLNLSCAKMFGYDYEEMFGKSITEFVNQKDFQNTVVKNIKESHSLPYEIEGIKKDGTRFPIEIEGKDVFISSENKILRVAAIRDITERKKAEQIQKVLYNISNAVIVTENIEKLIGKIQIELGKIIDSTNFHITFYDEKTDLISVPFFSNKEVNSAEIATGKTLTRYLINQKRSLLINKEKLVELRKSNEIKDFQVDPEIWLGVPLKNEEILTGVLVVQSYTDKNAYNEFDLKMLEFVAEQVGISIHRKKAELDLVLALRKATESDRLKSAFLATMSHELRTPLNAIIGFSEFLNKDLPMDDVENFGQIINSSGQNLLSIIDDLFDITLIEAGETKVRNEETTLKTIFYDVHSVIEAKKQRDNNDEVELKLNFSSEKEDFSFNTDANKIKQILINLLKNALKFTHEGYIDYGCELISEQHKAFLKFYVKDSGIGISKDKQELIFDIFRQVEDNHTRSYGGTGIGLSVAKRLSEILGGKIWLESEVGVGSTFYFTIPVQKPDDINLPSLEEEESATRIAKKRKTILIVEDDLMSFKFIEIVLAKLEIDFVWVKNGEEAIRTCKENPDIDLVLMDINLPILNGYAATKEIKQTLPNLPIIAQTAFAIAGDREKSLEAGCDDYITKPINKDELAEIIWKYLNK